MHPWFLTRHCAEQSCICLFSSCRARCELAVGMLNGCPGFPDFQDIVLLSTGHGSGRDGSGRIVYNGRRRNRHLGLVQVSCSYATDLTNVPRSGPFALGRLRMGSKFLTNSQIVATERESTKNPCDCVYLALKILHSGQAT